MPGELLCPIHLPILLLCIRLKGHGFVIQYRLRNFQLEFEIPRRFKVFEREGYRRGETICGDDKTAGGNEVKIIIPIAAILGIASINIMIAIEY